jgi:glycosyltransferase involved in cell wall biosynthesis
VQGGRRQKVEAYTHALPAVFIPNFAFEPYDLCAAISQSANASRMRLIGMCHSFEPSYFFTLCYYAPLISRFIAVSDECARILRKQLPDRSDDVLVRPYGVEIPPVSNRAYAATGRPLRLIYAGRIVQRQKRVMDLLALAAELARRKVSFTLSIVGDGPEKSALQRRLAALSDAARAAVTLLPPLPPSMMPEVLQRHDVCVLASEFEGTSIFMLEGMANGCVPVVTQVSGTPAMVRDRINGFTVPVGHVSAMADRIAMLAADRDMLAGTGAQARGTIQAHSLERYVEWFEHLTDTLWHEPPRVWASRRMPGLLARRAMYRAMEQLRGVRAVRAARDLLVGMVSR